MSDAFKIAYRIKWNALFYFGVQYIDDANQMRILFSL